MAALQAGVGPGEAAFCAEHYPEVFEAWLREGAAEGGKRQRQALLDGLQKRLGR